MSITLLAETADHIQRLIDDLRKRHHMALRDLDRARADESHALDEVHALREQLEQLRNQLRTKDEVIAELRGLIGGKTKP